MADYSMEYIKSGKGLPPLKNEPAIERPKGKWLKANKPQHYYCSVCGGMNHSARYGDWREIFEFKYPYCPLCGAKMEVTE